METIATPPEADLRTIAAGDFSALSTPILVAAASMKQFNQFIWNEGLICSHVHRFQKVSDLWTAQFPENKILLLLPGYHADAATYQAVTLWVDACDRYTVELLSPWPDQFKPGRAGFLRFALAASILIAALMAWLVMR